MHLVTRSKKFSDVLPARASLSEALMIRRLLGSLPSALKTPNALTLLETYFHIPQPSTRRLVLMLFARITGGTDNAYPSGQMTEVEYLLTQYTQLHTDDARDKVLAMVRQICVANGGDIEDLREEK